MLLIWIAQSFIILLNVSYDIPKKQMSIRAISLGEQLTVDYGKSFWHARRINPADL
jgi:hypothetical protein